VSDVPADDLFLDPQVPWQQVSPRLVTEYRLWWLLVGAVGVVMLGIGVVLELTDAAPWWPFGIAAAPFLVLFAVGWWWFAPRTATSWYYAERDQDLLVRRGRMFRKVVVVPYGRMQVIEVRSDPVANWLGTATVQLVTASASTDARIPGVPAAEARALRDRLAARGEASAAGL
jgi:membrane protein YdbS with pleckstrin-like domain